MSKNMHWPHFLDHLVCVCVMQAEEILRAAVEDVSCLDHWTAVRCLACYGECNEHIVTALLRQLFTTHSEHRQLQAAKHLITLSQQSVCHCFLSLEQSNQLND